MRVEVYSGYEIVTYCDWSCSFAYIWKDEKCLYPYTIAVDGVKIYQATRGEPTELFNRAIDEYCLNKERLNKLSQV
jgi:hypothetical protein